MPIKIKHRDAIPLLPLLVLLFAFLNCPEGFKRNSDLTYLVSPENDCFCPVWAPGGGEIYFLDGQFLWNSLENDWDGSLYEVSVSSGEKKKVLDGRFMEFDVSADGKKLALVEAYEHRILLLDLGSMNLDTILKSQYRISDIKFSRDGSKIFYSIISSDSGGVWSVEVESKELNRLIKVNRDYYYWCFDVTSADSIFVLANRQYSNLEYSVEDTVSVKKIFTMLFSLWPKASPTNPDMIAMVSGEGELGDSAITVLRLPDTNKVIIDTRITKEGRSTQPCWSPDGNQIAFCAAEFIDYESGHMEKFSLWILKNVKNYIK